MSENTLKNPEAEADLASRLNAPRAAFKRWREEGTLKPEEHWFKTGNTFMLTAAGVDEVHRLLGLSEAIVLTAPPKVTVRVTVPGSNPRLLRGQDANGPCSIKLTAGRVFAAHFRRHDALECEPTETPGIYEYHGKAPRRAVI
jgi:hypothetical protein